MGFEEKLKRINARYRKTKGTKPSGFNKLPKGTYQLTITNAEFIPESKAPFALGQTEVKLSLKVLSGDFSGKATSTSYFLEQGPQEINGVAIDSGLAQFKGLCEALGVSDPFASMKTLKKALSELKGMNAVFYSSGKSLIFNGPLDVADDDDIDDESFDDEDEYEDEDDISTTPEDEEEVKPSKKKASKKSASKKAKPKPEEDEDDEEEELDDDDDELDIDDEEFE